MDYIENYKDKRFENIKHIDENGNEFWLARELQKVLEYKEWRNFKKVIDKAIMSANNSIHGNEDWVVEFNKPIITGKGKQEIIKDYKLSRYICYLIVQNADPSKEIVALGQTYFAIQTRKAELTEEEYKRLTEDEKRLYRRKQTRDGNKVLYKTAKEKGVKNYDRFTNAGYKGLYNGETANDIAKRKGLRYREDILDNMCSVELGANIFRITQTEALLEKQEEPNEKVATDTHYRVGKAVRDTIKQLGGTMPEDLPTPEKSIKELEKEKQKSLSKTGIISNLLVK